MFTQQFINTPAWTFVNENKEKYSQVRLDTNALHAIILVAPAKEVPHGRNTWGTHGDVDHAAHRR